MGTEKKRFERYEPSPAQAKKIEEVESAYKFVYTVLLGLRPEAGDKGLTLKYLGSSVDHLEDSLTKARMAILHNDNIKQEEEPK